MELASLLERDGELERISAARQRARQGIGNCVLIEGPAGAGKSALLEAAKSAAYDDGFLVLDATGREPEREFGFGVAVQLFAATVERAPAPERDALFRGAADLARPLFGSDTVGARNRELFSFLHGLHWLIGNIAERMPVALVVDDAHWADPSSLAFIDYLAHRVGELEVILMVGVRTGETPEGSTLVEGLVRAEAVLVHPNPLSVTAIGTLLAETIGDDRLAAECARVTRGNPLFVRELVREIGERGGVELIDIGEIAPAGVARIMLERFRNLDPTDIRAAEALAVLGGEAGVYGVAELTGADAPATARSLDRLIRSDLVVSGPRLGFTHPILARALYDSLAEETRSRLHLRAARHLAGDPRACEHAAAHLLAVTLASEHVGSVAIEALRRAAQRASARGAGEQAVRFMERALEEQLEPQQRRAVLIELGAEQARLGRPEAIDSLESAWLLSQTPQERAPVALSLSIAQSQTGSLVGSVDTADRALEDLPEGGELRLALEAQRAHSAWVAACLDKAGLVRLRALEPEVLEGATPAQRLVLTVLAVEAGTAGTRTAVEVNDLADRALAGGRLLAEHGAEHPSFASAVAAKTLAGDLGTAVRVWDQGVQQARAAGSITGYASALLGRAYTRTQLGLMEAAEADAVEAMALPLGDLVTSPLSLATRVEVSVERGPMRLRDFESELRLLSSGEKPAMATISYTHVAVGWLALRNGDPPAAYERFSSAGAKAQQAGWLGASCLPWRSGAALALLAMGRRAEALMLIADEVGLAESFGAAPALGLSWRTKGRVLGGQRGIELTRQAIEVLADADARLEQARALVQLGEMLIERGDLVESRAPLRDGMDLAHRRGAEWTVERALQALRASGARPRRPIVRGPGALSPQERQTASLAVQGLTNREIAEAMFLTRRTVEMHLTGSYRKLGITSRRELPAALGET